MFVAAAWDLRRTSRRVKTPEAFASSSVAWLLAASLTIGSSACRTSDGRGSLERQGSLEADAGETTSNDSGVADSTPSVGHLPTQIPALRTDASYPCPPGQVVFEAPRARMCAKPCLMDADCGPAAACISGVIAVERGGHVTNFVGFCAPFAPAVGVEEEAGTRD